MSTFFNTKRNRQWKCPNYARYGRYRKPSCGCVWCNETWRRLGPTRRLTCAWCGGPIKGIGRWCSDDCRLDFTYHYEDREVYPCPE